MADSTSRAFASANKGGKQAEKQGPPGVGTKKAHSAGGRAKAKKGAKRGPVYSAKGVHRADKHTLYQLAVQSPEAEVEFVSNTFKRLRGRPARLLREDFCGTAYSSCAWVALHTQNRAVGVDLHKPTLAWGVKHNLSTLNQEQRERLTLVAADVRTPGEAGLGIDAVLAMNFSYWIFKRRQELLEYFRAVHHSLAPDGVFFLDHYGGYDASREFEERRRLKGFTYIWDQASYDPITADKVCHIHFDFPDGTRMERAFSYNWRLWTLPEIRELLAEAGFANVVVYWEGDDGKGGGNGIFRPRRSGDADASYICYISASK